MTAGQQSGADKTSIRPFRVNFPDAELVELRNRINATRWPDRETVADQSQGVQLATMQRSRATGRPNMTGARSKRNSTPCHSS